MLPKQSEASFFRLGSLKSGFLGHTQLFSPNTLNLALMLTIKHDRSSGHQLGLDSSLPDQTQFSQQDFFQCFTLF